MTNARSYDEAYAAWMQDPAAWWASEAYGITWDRKWDAVFDPDITYKLNDPGMSAVWCLVPAVKAAVATGVVDSEMSV